MWATIDDIRERLATEKGRITIGSEDTDTFTEDEVSKAIDLAHLRLKNKFQISDEVEGEIDTTKPVGALLKECEILSTCLDLLSRLPQNELVVELEEVRPIRHSHGELKVNCIKPQAPAGLLGKTYSTFPRGIERDANIPDDVLINGR